LGQVDEGEIEAGGGDVLSFGSSLGGELVHGGVRQVHGGVQVVGAAEGIVSFAGVVGSGPGVEAEDARLVGVRSVGAVAASARARLTSLGWRRAALMRACWLASRSRAVPLVASGRADSTSAAASS
jgi:hypothetical protein